ncbi:MAG: PAS domain-containing protein [Bacteroidetes bacterium]|nr:PAS domain-containing protein [Bacteroidota bacterium]
MSSKEFLTNELLVDKIFQVVQSIMYVLEIDKNSSEIRLTKISGYVTEVLGYSSQEFVDDPDLWFSIIHPEDKPIVKTVNDQLLSLNKPLPFTYRSLQKHTNQYRTFKDTINPIFDQSGKPIGFIGIMVDITSEKKTEYSLQSREQEIAHLLDLNPIILYKIDAKNFKPLYVSANITSFLGYSVTEALGANWWQSHLHPDNQQIAATVLNKTLKEGLYKHEYRFQKKNGEYIWILDDQRLFYDNSGNPEYITGVWLDITDRKNNEEKLKKSEELLRTIIYNLPLGLAINSTDPTVNFEFMNELFPMIYRTTKEKLSEPDSFWEAVYEDKLFREEIKQKVLNDCRSENPEIMHWDEIPLTRKGEKTTYINARNIPIPEKSLMISTVWDITEQKHLRDQLSHSQKIDSIGRLAGGIAHDFNNMLNVILGRAELAMENLLLNPQVLSDLQEIKDAAERSANLTRQLLAFSRQQPISPKILDINQEVESMIKMLTRLIGEDITLSWLPGKDIWSVQMDQTQIGQMLANLCINARDAIDGIGTITIETNNLQLDETDKFKHLDCIPGDYVMLSVSDTGCGMDKSVQEKVFEPFYTTKAVGSGTGLGLPTVYGIALQNKGGIHIYSEPDKGTTIKIFIPKFVGSNAKEPSLKISNSLHSGSETILLVEDEQSVRKLTSLLLTSLGYTVLTAESPSKALKIAYENSDTIDLLVTDVVMPEMNGKSLEEKIRLIIPTIKSLFTSGYTANVIANQGILKEGIIFIQKPFTKAELASKVKEALAK